MKKLHTKYYIFYDTLYIKFLEKETVQKESISEVA